VLALALSGCSFLQVSDSPHPAQFTKQPTCDPKGFPATDIIVAAALVGIGAGLLLSEPIDGHTRVKALDVVVLGGMGLLAVTFVASSVHGFRAISRCRGKLEAH
jgi:hypothetical protein